MPHSQSIGPQPETVIRGTHPPARPEACHALTLNKHGLLRGGRTEGINLRRLSLVRSITSHFVKLAILLISSTFWGTVHAQAQSSCVSLPSLPGPLGYQSRENNSWCEGLYRAPVSGGIEIIGFSQIDLSCEDGESIAISAKGVKTTDRYLLLGRSVSFGHYYRYDRWQTGQEEIVINPGTVIKPSSIPLLGVYFTAKLEGALIPIQISYEPPAGSHCADTETSAGIMTTLLSPQFAEELFWRYSDCQDSDAWQSPSNFLRTPPLSPITFAITPPQDGSTCTLEIRLRHASGSWSSASLPVQR